MTDVAAADPGTNRDAARPGAHRRLDAARRRPGLREVYDAVVTLPHAADQAPDAAGLTRTSVAANVFLSWLVLHAVYAELYAAKFYRDGGCLHFPGTDTPDYRDFAYFSYSIGMTFGTSDVEAGPSFRRMMLPHKLFTFAFNTAILALVVNTLPG